MSALRNLNRAALAVLLVGLVAGSQVGPARAGKAALEVRVAPNPVARISPEIFGVNYDWNKVSANRTREWMRAVRNISNARLVLYPGGWNPEHLNWATNTERRWRNGTRNGFDPRVDPPGASPSQIIAEAPKVAFVTPSFPAIRDPTQRDEVVAVTQDLVARYGRRVSRWDIGNEWWIQRGGNRRPEIRAENLRRYGALVSAAVPAMKAKNPRSAVFVGGDWQRAEDFARLRMLVGPEVWRQIDGISIHTYCNGVHPRCSSIPEVANTVRRISGKSRIFDSQWFVTRGGKADNFGILNANRLVLAVRDVATAGIEAAVIWPVTDFIPGLNFFSSDYSVPFASGIVFGWMSRYYRGVALSSSGDLPVAAARSDGAITVFVPSMRDGPTEIAIPLTGLGVSRVVDAEVLYSGHPHARGLSRLAHSQHLPTRIGPGNRLEFVLNTGRPSRGPGWEIARITLR